MNKGCRSCWPVVLGAALILLSFSSDLTAESDPLRSGKVLSTKSVNAITYIRARDEAGKDFWIMTATCTVGKGGKIEVISGFHFDRIRSETLGKTMKDVYSAYLIRVNGQVIKGLSAHGLPRGCVDLE